MKEFSIKDVFLQDVCDNMVPWRPCKHTKSGRLRHHITQFSYDCCRNDNCNGLCFWLTVIHKIWRDFRGQRNREALEETWNNVLRQQYEADGIETTLMNFEQQLELLEKLKNPEHTSNIEDDDTGELSLLLSRVQAPALQDQAPGLQDHYMTDC